MLRKLLTYMIFLLLLLKGNFLFGQKKLIMVSQDDDMYPHSEMYDSKGDTLFFRLTVKSYFLEEVETPQGKASKISSFGCTPHLRKGWPDVPKFSRSFIVEQGKEYQAEIIDSHFITLNDIQIASSPGSVKRGLHSTYRPDIHTGSNTGNAFLPGPLCKSAGTFFMRDYKGQTFLFYPFQYNSSKKELRIYHTISVKLYPQAVDEPVRPIPVKENSAEFENIYTSLFANYPEKKRYTPVEEEGRLLIISHPDFIQAMEPYIKWKTEKGIPTELIDIETIGDAENLKSYVENYYNNKGLTYLLLVGDSHHVPPYFKTGYSDAAYGHITGNDSYAEVIVGRFSAENIDQVKSQVERTIYYEKQPTSRDTWYENAMLVASEEGIGDDEEYDWEHMRNIVPDLTGFTYRQVYELYDGSQGGDDKPGDPGVELFIENFNSGIGMMSYIGHGETDFIYTTGFSNDDVPFLDNTGMLPFIFIVACDNGNFIDRTCLAETWMRAEKNGGHTGAVCVLASTIDQEWDPPMAAHDEMIDILTESYPDNRKRTFGGIAVNGCMLMNDEYPIYGPQMTDTWAIFGDPTLNVRTAAPTYINLSHPAYLDTSLNNFEIICNEENVTASLTYNGQILSTTGVVNGAISLKLDRRVKVDTMLLTITGFNKIPYQKKLPVKKQSFANPKIDALTINDEQGNNNGIAEFGETISLSLEFSNDGNRQPENIQAEISTKNPHISIVDKNAFIPSIKTGCCSESKNLFLMDIAKNIPDKTKPEIKLNLRDDLDSSWNLTFNFPVSAPVLSVTKADIVNESIKQNGRIDIGEQFEIQFVLKNSGPVSLHDAYCIIDIQDVSLVVQQDSFYLGSVNAGEKVTFHFPALCSRDIPPGTSLKINLNIRSEGYEKILVSQHRIGLYVEDWEKGDFTSFKWKRNNYQLWQFGDSIGKNKGTGLRSAEIGDDDTSGIEIMVEVLSDDSVCFDRRVSSEEDFDYLHFLIDGISSGNWSGETGWGSECFTVSEGVHTFSWLYTKDFFRGSGEDLAIIDNIILPVHNSINSPPEITTEPITEVKTGKLYSYPIKVLDDNPGDTIIFTPAKIPGWINFVNRNNGLAVLSGIPQEEDIGTIEIAFSATDGTDVAAQNFYLSIVSDVDVPEKSNEVRLFPNPLKDELHCEVTVENPKRFSYRIIDVAGRLHTVPVESILNNNNRIVLNFETRGLRPGIYYLTLFNDGNQVTNSFVVTDRQ